VSQRVDQVPDERVAFFGIDPTVESPSRARVPEHGVEARARILQVMEDSDAVDEVELAEVDPGQVSAMELDANVRDVLEVATRGLQGVPELDSAKASGAEAGHMIKERTVSETELQYVLAAKALGIERGHPLEELGAGISGALRESIPRLGEGGRGLDVVVSHSLDRGRCCYPFATHGSMMV
jgi:hypothetical protein